MLDSCQHIRADHSVIEELDLSYISELHKAVDLVESFPRIDKIYFCSSEFKLFDNLSVTDLVGLKIPDTV
jgi:hypothetical protein